MSFLCRVGVHRWSFSARLLDEPGRRTSTEVIRARCRRRGCIRYGDWSLVHQEALLGRPVTPDSPAAPTWPAGTAGRAETTPG